MKKKDYKFYWENQDKEKNQKIQSDLGRQGFTLSLPELGFPNINVMISTIPVDIRENEKEVVVRARMPGYKKSEISLNVTETSIEISASKKEERVERGEHVFRQERSAGTQHMEFSLPSRVDTNKSRAKLEDGLLTVVMPKVEFEKKKKKVDVK